MRILATFAILAVTAAALAGEIPLLNADIENNSSGLFGPIDDWGPNGGWADHASFPAGNNGTLGANFGFYSANTTETVGQVTAAVFEPETEYVFKSWAIGGGNRVGTIPYQIGYDDGGNFVPLATQTYVLDGAQDWAELAGVTYVTGTAGAELGMPIWVRLGDGAAGGASDIWFDSFSLTPEPTSLLLLALAGLGLRSRNG